MITSRVKYLILIIFVVGYSAFQAITYYRAEISERALVNNKLEYNLQSLQTNQIEANLAEYDKKYGTTLGLYGKAQPEDGKPQRFFSNAQTITSSSCLDNETCTREELIAITKQLMNANNEEPFWSLNAIIKCFVYPLIAGFILILISKRI